MIVLTTSTSSQSINVITRGNAVPTVLLLTDEETNTTESITIESYTSGDYYDTLTATFALKEGRFYTLKLQNYDNDDYLQANDFSFILTSQNDKLEINGYTGTTEVLHYAKVFCTDQPGEYSVNDGVYQQKNSTNDFIYL